MSTARQAATPSPTTSASQPSSFSISSTTIGLTRSSSATSTDTIFSSSSPTLAEGGCVSRRATRRKIDPEMLAGPRLAAHLHLAAHQLSQSLDDGQAQPAAAMRKSSRVGSGAALQKRRSSSS